MKSLFRSYKGMIASLVAGAIILSPLAFAPVQAQLFQGSIDEACKGASLDNSDGCKEAQAQNQVNNTVKNGFNIFSVVIGVIAVIMVIISGIKYVTSSGDPQSVNSAKNTLLYAIIGLVIVAMSQAIVRFVITETTSTDKNAPLLKGDGGGDPADASLDP